MTANSRRILVVDDDEDIRGVLTRFFSDAGHDVRAAADGRAGLADFRSWQPHVILLDLEMPEMNGLDLLRYIRAESVDAAVVAFSGHSAAEHLGQDARRLGASEFLVKPFDLEALGGVVERLSGNGS